MSGFPALPEPVIEGEVVRREVTTLVPCLGLGCMLGIVPVAFGILFLMEKYNFRLDNFNIPVPCAVGIGILAAIVLAAGVDRVKWWIDV